MSEEAPAVIENRWDGDVAFEDHVISRVGPKSKDSWDVGFAGALGFWVPGNSPVEPKVGMVMRLYGVPGPGGVVRGMFLDWTCIYYRTEAEQRELDEVRIYGQNATEMLARWDSGQSVHSIVMGGIGPGYEQAIQVAAFEVLRHCLARAYPEPDFTDDDRRRVVQTEIDAVVDQVDRALGMSGAQRNAAVFLGIALYRTGPRELMKARHLQTRHILVSRHLPEYPPREGATDA